MNNEELRYCMELTGEKSEDYPNEVAFSPQNLLNPSIAGEVAAAFNITPEIAALLLLLVGFNHPPNTDSATKCEPETLPPHQVQLAEVHRWLLPH